VPISGSFTGHQIDPVQSRSQFSSLIAQWWSDGAGSSQVAQESVPQSLDDDQKQHVPAPAGAPTGLAVGFAAGLAVGAAVGEKAVGGVTGCAVGLVVGAAVGEAVGGATGCAVGLTVGSAVGSFSAQVAQHPSSALVPSSPFESQ